MAIANWYASNIYYRGICQTRHALADEADAAEASSAHPHPDYSIPRMTVAMPGERNDEHAFLDSVEGEISFFRSIMRARPIGMHRYFHILAIRSAIQKDTGRAVHTDTLWEKLRKCYDLDALDAIVRGPP